MTDPYIISKGCGAQVFRIHRSLSEYPGDSGRTALTLGVFDGFHPGHLAIINKTLACKKRAGSKSVLITFGNHPDVILKKNTLACFIYDHEIKMKILRHLGVDTCIMLDFSMEFAGMSAYTFMRALVGFLHPGCVVIGYDYRFGSRGSGDFHMIERFSDRFGFTVIEVDPVKRGGLIVSSTLIRKYLSEGSIGKANGLLYLPYSVEGKVTRGRKIGSAIGVPTANIVPPSNILVPDGIYAVYALIGGALKEGVASLGNAPTFNNGGAAPRVLEVHLLNSSENCYGRKMRVFFLSRLRNQRKFSGAAPLVGQIRSDIEKCKKLFLKSKYIGMYAKIKEVIRRN